MGGINIAMRIAVDENSKLDVSKIFGNDKLPSTKPRISVIMNVIDINMIAIKYLLITKSFRDTPIVNANLFQLLCSSRLKRVSISKSDNIESTPKEKLSFIFGINMPANINTTRIMRILF